MSSNGTARPPSLSGRDFIAAMGPSAYTDVGNAERFAYYHGADVYFVPAARMWYVWDGVRWRRDDLLRAEIFAQQVARSIYEEARAAEDREHAAALGKWAVASEGAGRLRSMLEVARPKLAAPLDLFDADPYLLTVANGTLDLRTATLKPHDREDHITRASPVAWDPTAECPRWERFLLEITNGRPELVSFLQRAWGSTLTGASLRDQSALLCYGSGANGKSVMVGVQRAVFGDYAMEADFTTFIEQPPEKARPDLARLAGARLVYAEENREGARLSESVIKNLTGGGRVVARYLYEREFSYLPTFKIWLATNHKPVIRATDFGLWRRVNLLPFDVRFEGPAAQLDLEDQLKASELPGILRWTVAGSLMWRRDGLCPPEVVRAATAEYRNESDIVGLFLEERCVLDARAESESAALYQSYRSWADEQGERPMTMQMFGRRLKERGLGDATRRIGPRVAKVRIGVRLVMAGVTGSESWSNYRTSGE